MIIVNAIIIIPGDVIKTELIVKDFRKSFEEDFFSDIEEKINKLDGNISILVNNVAHRSAWAPYHEMPQQLINDTIAVGTIVQSQLIRICIPHFLKRKKCDIFAQVFWC